MDLSHSDYMADHGRFQDFGGYRDTVNQRKLYGKVVEENGVYAVWYRSKDGNLRKSGDVQVTLPDLVNVTLKRIRNTQRKQPGISN